MALLPRFLRLVDAMLAEALAGMVEDSLAAALRTLRASGAAGAASAPAAAGGEAAGGPPAAAGGEGEAAALPAEGQQDGEGAAGVAHGMLLADVVFTCGGGAAAGDCVPCSTAFSPSCEDWLAALEAQLLEEPAALAASVPPLASLPAFAKYFPAAAGAGGSDSAEAEGADSAETEAAEGEKERAGGESGGPYLPTDGGAVARASSAFQAGRQELAALLAGCYESAGAFGTHYNPHRSLHDFHRAFDPELYAQRHRCSTCLQPATCCTHLL